MKLAFFDTKSYDIPGFDRYGIPAGVEIKKRRFRKDY